MSIGISDEHVELAKSLVGWATDSGAIEAVRSAEGDPAADFADIWKACTELGAATIGLAETAGGGGGTPLDAAVALEACAYGLVPGPLLSVAVACALLGDHAETAKVLGAGGIVGLGLTPDLRLVADAESADALLVPDEADVWRVVPAAAMTATSVSTLDLSRRFAAVEADLSAGTEVSGLTTDAVRRTLITFAAAEAAGIARWCLDTAVAYAGVREQFGQKIGAFQAIKHLCAEMLETAEAVTAAAWDVAAIAFDPADDDHGQWAFAADVAAVTCFDGAVENAKNCIQVLGGIGFTYEHDAHLYLRRALSLRALVGDADAAATSLAHRAMSGVHRQVHVDLEGRDQATRAEVRAEAQRLAALPAEELRPALVENGYLMPHWPAPYGIGADPVAQIVIDEELGEAGVERPDIVIAAWAVPTILEHGTDEQRESFVRPSLLGDLVWCQLFSEPGAGSDLAALRTKAERVDGGWKLTGQKVWNSVAERADWGICLARTDPEAAKHKGITYFLVDMRSPGIEVRPLREITGEALFNEVFLDDVFVPDDRVVGAVNDGWKLARTTLSNERVAMANTRLDKSAARAVALAREGVSAAAEARVGRAVALSTVCGLLAVRSTLRSLAGQGPGAESSVAKLLGVRNRQDASELVVTLQGAGLLAPEGQVAKDVWEMLNTRCLSIAGGTTQILRNIAGERLLGLPR
jgi:alkylation response protein AidB-like acyl-CoA dehydrogenase